jgi:hypothetical protein
MRQSGILKLCFCLLLLSAAAYGVDTDVNNVYWNWSSGGLWMDTSEWSDSGTGPEWAIPGWVVGNPRNTGGSTDVNWNLGRAVVDGGGVLVTPASRPDGRVERIYVGGESGASLDISGDISFNEFWVGRWTKTESGTVNQTAGTVTIQNRAYIGDNGNATYNLSGGTLVFLGGGTVQIGNNESSVGTFNQTGGSVIADGGTSSFYLARYAGSYGTYNLSAGTLSHNNLNNFWVGLDGTAYFNQTGGSINTGKFYVGGNADSSGSVYTISDGTLNAQYVRCTYGTMTVVGTGPDKITTNRLVASGSGKLKFILGAAGCTRIDVNGTEANTYFGVSLRRGTIEVETAVDYTGTIGSYYDVIWSAEEIDTYRLKITDDSSTHDFKYAVVDGASNGYSGGYVLRLIETTGHCGDQTHEFPAGDVDQNCRVDFLDFAALAEDWMYDGVPFAE